MGLDLQKDIATQGLEVIVASNPRNPMGQVVMGEDLKALINVCKPHTMLILDEVITFRSQFLSIISMKERNEWPFRISPICCKACGSWPLLCDDCRCFFFFSTCDDILELPH